MVGKNKDHPSRGIQRCKNKRYSYESTHKYQIGGDSTKIGRAGTKIGGPVMDFSVVIYFEEGGQSSNLSISSQTTRHKPAP